jgi:hypothetical protein
MAASQDDLVLAHAGDVQIIARSRDGRQRVGVRVNPGGDPLA